MDWLMSLMNDLMTLIHKTFSESQQTSLLALAYLLSSDAQCMSLREMLFFFFSMVSPLVKRWNDL